MPLKGLGGALFAAPGLTGGTTASPKDGFNVEPSTATHYEGGFGLGDIISGSYEKDGKSVSLSPPTSLKYFGKDGGGAALYGGVGTAHITTVNIPVPLSPEQAARLYYWW